MEQVRLIIAIVLSVAVFLAWDYFFLPDTPPPQPPQQAAQSPAAARGQEQETASREVSGQPGPAPAPALETAPVPAPGAPARTLKVQTPLYDAELSTRGAAITRLTLMKYRASPEEDAPFYEMISLPTGEGSLAAGFAGGSVGPLATGTWELSSPAGDVVRLDHAPQNVVFTYSTDQGVTVEKTYTFRPDSYLVGVSVRVANGSGLPVNDRLFLDVKNRLGKPKRVVFQGPLALVNGSVVEVDANDAAKKGHLSGDVDWAGITGRYFLSAVAPDTEGPADVRMSTSEDGMLRTRFLYPQEPVPPGAEKTFYAEAFFGPKSTAALKQAGHQLPRALHFGWFDFLAKPLLWLMNVMHRFIPNYGVAIILLTILVKLLFWPLSNKSYQSMAAMKKLAPLMQEIREKYKDDKKKMNEEVFALYRTFKVNPLSGCLPMIVQIPVFIALYKMLYEAIELRHAPFLLWINDLSAPDRLFRFDFSIPFMEAPYGIPVLTLLMGASMFIQQKMTPSPGDPSQAKMMMFLPILFTFIFINFPSGLVLYWLVNNILSMAQQYYIQKKAA
ncbi:MAG: membrane protein insertase YidC [Deltaproteobacteria bacterium]|nr:membrane protein insertase YidC [Deltaproteobacteria bacterium]